MLFGDDIEGVQGKVSIDVWYQIDDKPVHSSSSLEMGGTSDISWPLAWAVEQIGFNEPYITLARTILNVGHLSSIEDDLPDELADAVKNARVALIMAAKHLADLYANPPANNQPKEDNRPESPA